MSKKALRSLGNRASSRLRTIRRRAADWRRRARRAVALAAITGGMAFVPSLAEAQMGQAAMAPAGGIVNRAVNGFQQLNANGPGYFYYGLNAADRGLGYYGSYMTLGGFIPMAEDDLGGFWAADLRGHLSTFGGFFSNAGMVRKQFLGGTLLGVGVYWDYDGDQNQYQTAGVIGTEQLGSFGHSYNQVGVSAEWLTDYGNLRSNGYMPVGTTAYTAGAPDSPFYKNYVMCQYGLDAALTGADLEVGAYIPGLSDWAGMISVGGYALGNARYDWNSGPLDNTDVVPWFGGVYTRLDMTFLNNWDFSLQANNDSYFDWTGFARLTYRMGGSRRRNVPDQMEQPMMRNEHIVRAHQTPIVATNPDDAASPWRVIHIDNSAAAGGDGTFERPLNTLAEGSTAATNPWDIVFVHEGLSRTTTPYGGTFTFQAQNQFLVGDGGTFELPTVTCGPKLLSTGATSVPLLSNPAGDSIAIVGPAAAGATVADLDILGSRTGIYAAGPLTSDAGRPTVVQNVTISGNGTTASQTGVYLEAASGDVAFSDTAIANMTNGGLVVTDPGAGPLNLDYQGSITSDTSLNGGAVSPIVYIADVQGGTLNIATGGSAAGSTVANSVSDKGGSGIQLVSNAAGTTIDIGNVSLTDNAQTAISVVDDASTTFITADAGSGIQKKTNGAAISVSGGTPTFTYDGPITNELPAAGGTTSYLLSVADTTGGSVTLTASGSPFSDTGNGISVNNAGGDVTVNGLGATIASSGAQGILIDGPSSTGTYLFTNVSITNASQAGVLINNAPGSTEFRNLNISLDQDSATAFQAASAGPITANVGSNTIINESASQAAVDISASGPLDVNFSSIQSGNNSTVPTSPTALMFDTSTGTFNVTSLFTVDGSAGTTANVTNDGTTTVSLPP
jgi:hypothetical protein